MRYWYLGTPTIKETWQRMEERLTNLGMTARDLTNMREAAASILYAASKDVLMCRADPRDLSEAAYWLENQR